MKLKEKRNNTKRKFKRYVRKHNNLKGFILVAVKKLSKRQNIEYKTLFYTSDDDAHTHSVLKPSSLAMHNVVFCSIYIYCFGLPSYRENKTFSIK